MIDDDEAEVVGEREMRDDLVIPCEVRREMRDSQGGQEK